MVCVCPISDSTSVLTSMFFSIGTYPNGVYDAYSGDSGRGPANPSYDLNSVLKSDANQAILSTGRQRPLSKNVILRMRKEAEIVEGPGPRNNTCRTVCLYDLHNDPTEKTDVKDKYPQVFSDLVSKLNVYRLQLRPQLNKQPDPKGAPQNCNNTWFTWLEPENPECTA